MGSLGVEEQTKLIEPPLQMEEVAARRTRGRYLQVAMHSLVSSVVLRLRRSAEDGTNSVLHGEGRDSPEVGEPGRTKRSAVVTVKFEGKTVLREGLRKHWHDRLGPHV